MLQFWYELFAYSLWVMILPQDLTWVKLSWHNVIERNRVEKKIFKERWSRLLKSLLRSYRILAELLKFSRVQ